MTIGKVDWYIVKFVATWVLFSFGNPMLLIFAFSLEFYCADVGVLTIPAPALRLCHRRAAPRHGALATWCHILTSNIFSAWFADRDWYIWWPDLKLREQRVDRKGANKFKKWWQEERKLTSIHYNTKEKVHCNLSRMPPDKSWTHFFSFFSVQLVRKRSHQLPTIITS